MTQRVAVFIDGSNLYHALMENCGRMDLDFSAFISNLCGQSQLFRAYYYNILQDSDRRGHAFQEQQKFLSTLYSTNQLEVRLGTSKYRGDVMVEKGVDIMMATDILQYAWKDLYDIALLVTGDGDFAYAVQTVKDFGKHVAVAAFKSNLSMQLSQVADVVQHLDKPYFENLWVSNRDHGDNGAKKKSNAPPKRRRRLRLPLPRRKKVENEATDNVE